MWISISDLRDLWLISRGQLQSLWGRNEKREWDMINVVAYFELADDSDWLSSPNRAEFLASLGTKARTFIEAEDPHRVVAFLEVPNLETVVEAMKDRAVIARLILQGVKMDTYRFFLEEK